MQNYVSNKAMSEKTAREVALWLKTLDRVVWARPVMVTIGKNVYVGAHYVQTVTPPSGARNSADYQHEDMYLIGRLPNVKDCGRFGFQPRKKFAYVADNGALFGVGFTTSLAYVTQEQRDLYYPFGEFFTLSPYSADILTNERTGVAYPQMRIGIEFI